MNCQQALEMIHPYLDREQNLIQAAELEQHLEQCEDCYVVYSGQFAMHSALRDASFHYKAPEHFKNRLRSLLAEEVNVEASQSAHAMTSSEFTSLQHLEAMSARRLRARAKRDITVPRGI